MCGVGDDRTPKSSLLILLLSLALRILCNLDVWGCGGVLDVVVMGDHTSKPFVPGALLVLDFSCAHSEFIRSMLVRNA